MNKRKVLAVLKKARRLIEKDGSWCQGQFTNEFGAHCTMGAVRQVDGYDDVYYDCADVLAPRGSTVVLWNDAPERTHAQVLRRFDYVIKKLSTP